MVISFSNMTNDQLVETEAKVPVRTNVYETEGHTLHTFNGSPSLDERPASNGILHVVSLLLMWGIRRDIRGLMLPWMFGMLLIFGYYIYLEGVFAALVDFAWLAYNTYCWQVVRNHYRNVKWFQSPDIEVLDEFVK